MDPEASAWATAPRAHTPAVYDAFLADDGKLGPNFTEDGLHLTKNAYSLWKKLITNQM